MAGCVLGLFWKLAGPGLFLALGMPFFLGDTNPGSLLDFAFVGVALAMITARMLDPLKPDKSESKEAGTLYVSRGTDVLAVAVVTTTILLLAHLIV